MAKRTPSDQTHPADYWEIANFEKFLVTEEPPKEANDHTPHNTYTVGQIIYYPCGFWESATYRNQAEWESGVDIDVPLLGIDANIPLLGIDTDIPLLGIDANIPLLGIDTDGGKKCYICPLKIKEDLGDKETVLTIAAEIFATILLGTLNGEEWPSKEMQERIEEQRKASCLRIKMAAEDQANESEYQTEDIDVIAQRKQEMAESLFDQIFELVGGIHPLKTSAEFIAQLDAKAGHALFPETLNKNGRRYGAEHARQELTNGDFGDDFGPLPNHRVSKVAPQKRAAEKTRENR